jgi:hypothetical protein
MNVAAYGDAVSSVIEAHRTILQRVRPLWTLSLLSGFGWLDCVYSGEAEFQRVEKLIVANLHFSPN